MRDRLIELLIKATDKAGKHLRENTKKVLAEKGSFNSKEDIDRRNIYEVEADYLLANGVIVPPCKVGQTVYAIDRRSQLWWKGTAMSLCYTGTGMEFGVLFDDGEFAVYKDDAVFLTKEEAEAKLKGGAE